VLPLAARAEGPTPAAEAEPDDTVVYRAEEIIVADQRIRPAEIFEATPVEIEVLTAEEIERMPAQNGADVLGFTPGIRLQQRVQGEDAAVSIEGMPATYTLILVDGHRYSGEIGGTSDLRDFQLANLERLEIIRGASGLRYGPEAGGGVINFVTKPAPRDGSTRAEGQAGYGSDRRIYATGTAAGGTGDVGATLSYTRDQIDGYDPPPDTGNAVFIPSGSDSRLAIDDVYGTIEADPHDRVSLRSRVGFRRELDSLADPDGLAPPGERWTCRWLFGQDVGLQLGDSTELVASINYFDARTDSEVGREFTLEESEVEIDAEVASFLPLGSTSHLLSFGLEATTPRLHLDDEGPPPSPNDPTPSRVRVDEGFETLGLYAITESQLTRWMDVQAGLRAQFHTEFEPTFLPQVAFLFRPWQGDDGGSLALRVSYGRNRRTPSLRDLYQPDSPQLGFSYFLSGNPDLQPETSDSYRASIEYAPVRQLSFALSGFWNDIEDHIRSTNSGRTIVVGSNTIGGNDPGTRPGLDLICRATDDFFPECSGLAIDQAFGAPVFEKSNLDTVRTAGIEARMQWRPAFGLDLRLGYTFLDTEVVDSNIQIDELPNEAPHVIDAEASYATPWTDTRITGRLRWRSSAPIETSGTGLLGFTTNERSDPSVQLDFRVEQPIADWLSVYVDMHNVTDTRVVDSYVVRGRTFFGAIRAKWN